jgi:sodium-dependent dicarboxylate transporter 2/3/5
MSLEVIAPDETAGPGAPTGPARGVGVRWWIGLVLGPALFLIAVSAPPLPDVTPAGMRTLGTFLLVVTWWIAEPVPIPVTAFIGMALLVIVGVFPVERAFGYWANWINIFLIGAFVIGHATNLHGFNRRFAYSMLSLPFVAGRPWALLWTFWGATALLSAVSSNVVCTIVFMSIGIGLLDVLKVPRGHPVGGVLMLGVAFAAGIGGIGTPVGSPPNLIAIGMLDRAGQRVGFLEWSAIGLTTTLVLAGVLFAVMRWVARPDVSPLRVSHDLMRRELDSLGPAGRGERLAVAALLLALALWLLPDMSGLWLGARHPVTAWLQTRFNWAISAIVLASALFLVPVDLARGRFLMHWDEAVKGIDWATLALVAGALALGDAIASPAVGLGTFLSTQVADILEGSSWVVFVGGCVAATVLITSFMSNNATVSMVVPIALGIANAPGSAVEPAPLVIAIGMASSMAFALPAATPPMAIVYASGRVRITDMVRYGSLLALLSIAVVTLVAYTIAASVL